MIFELEGEGQGARTKLSLQRGSTAAANTPILGADSNDVLLMAEGPDGQQMPLLSVDHNGTVSIWHHTEKRTQVLSDLGFQMVPDLNYGFFSTSRVCLNNFDCVDDEEDNQ